MWYESVTLKKHDCNIKALRSLGIQIPEDVLRSSQRHVQPLYLVGAHIRLDAIVSIPYVT